MFSLLAEILQLVPFAPEYRRKIESAPEIDDLIDLPSAGRRFALAGAIMIASMAGTLVFLDEP